LRGPFEEEEEGTGITSDVVKVKGEDPATPGLLPKGIDTGTVTIPQYRLIIKQSNTHTHVRMTSVASDVVNLQGEDPATPGPLI